MNIAKVLNTAWMWKCQRERRTLEASTHRVAQTQADLLKRLLSCNSNTVYGTRHRFGSISTPKEFQRTVPLSTYDSYEKYIHRICQGEKNVLTREEVTLLEPTSGSTSGEKLIPYTHSLCAQFQRAVSAWIADLMSTRPATRRGRAYWSISPMFDTERRSQGGIPIGFKSDTEYLGLVGRLLANKLMAVPPAARTIQDMSDFRYYSLLHLVAAEDLALISVWSPTFLTSLLEPLEQWTPQLCSDIRHGTLNLPSSANSSHLPRGFKADKRRASQVEEILRSEQPLSAKTRLLWPNLALISCWADAAASHYLSAVRDLFPEVEIQPKGLLATEGFVSIPIEEADGAALAIDSHFFEFQEVDNEFDCKKYAHGLLLAHELSIGNKYAVIITTGGGLYRYQMYDVVEVVGFWNECPLLSFLGRSNHTCDLVGEKLQERHVRQVLERVWAGHGIQPEFSLLVPGAEDVPGYRLYLQGQEFEATESLATCIARDVQLGLEENPYYRHASQLGQLSTVRVHLLEPAEPPAWQIYEKCCTSNGQRAGDIKPTVLETRQGWFSDLAKLNYVGSRR